MGGTVATTQVGKYTLVRRLAVGGMAELFLARATGAHGFEKLVVLKRILPSFAQNPDFTRMFLTEARLAAGLDHPNIAHVFDFGEQDGSFFFTMEYVRGRDMRQIVRAAREKQKPLPLSVVIQVIVGMLAGLHHAHEHRDANGRPLEIVHRDISPANALVTYEGDIKLVDFGIAKAVALGPSTVAGTLKGKIAYMSPEQCRGDPLDRRSDLFSIGTLLWELTVGRRLFGSANGTNELTLLRVVDEAVVPAPASVVQGYPAELDGIVVKALARNPDDRFQTALEFRVALEAFAVEARLPISSANTSRFMEELFPADEREDPLASPGDIGTQSPLARQRKTSVTHTLPGTAEELTRPEQSAPLPIDTELVRSAPPPRRRFVPLVASLGALLLVSGGAYMVFGGSGDSADSAGKAAASGEDATRSGGAGAEGSASEAKVLAPGGAAPEGAAPGDAAAPEAASAGDAAAPVDPAAGDAAAPETAAAPSDDAALAAGDGASAPVSDASPNDTAAPDDAPAEPEPATKRRSKKRRKKASKPEPTTAVEPPSEPEPPPATEPKKDDPFMAPDPDRRRGSRPFF